jgi:hypothetical protein
MPPFHFGESLSNLIRSGHKTKRPARTWVDVAMSNARETVTIRQRSMGLKTAAAPA